MYEPRGKYGERPIVWVLPTSENMADDAIELAVPGGEPAKPGMATAVHARPRLEQTRASGREHDFGVGGSPAQTVGIKGAFDEFPGLFQGLGIQGHEFHEIDRLEWPARSKTTFMPVE